MEKEISAKKIAVDTIGKGKQSNQKEDTGKNIMKEQRVEDSIGNEENISKKTIEPESSENKNIIFERIKLKKKKKGKTKKVAKKKAKVTFKPGLFA